MNGAHRSLPRVSPARTASTSAELPREAALGARPRPPAFATFRVDERGQVITLDALARALLADDDGIVLAGGRLALYRPADDRELRRALGRRVGSTFFSIQRRSDRSPYLVTVSADGPGAIVRVHDRDEVLEPPLDALRRWFGVTSAEAALMIGLAHGKMPSEVAEQRGVAISTIRTQLSRLFAKTGTRRQTEVAALVARVCALMSG